jgi:AcrR family transcriptional regulator
MDLQRRILDAARELLVTEGYDAVSTRRIADAVGVTATSIYLHFESKNALFEALVDEGMDCLYARLTEARCSDSGAAGHDLAALCRAYLEFGLENPEYYELMFVIRTHAMSRFPAEKYRKARRNLDLLGDLLMRLDPEALPDQVRVAATSIWASLHGVVSLLNAHRIDRAIEPDQLVEHAIAMVSRPHTSHGLSIGSYKH